MATLGGTRCDETETTRNSAARLVPCESGQLCVLSARARSVCGQSFEILCECDKAHHRTQTETTQTETKRGLGSPWAGTIAMIDLRLPTGSPTTSTTRLPPLPSPPPCLPPPPAQSGTESFSPRCIVFNFNMIWFLRKQISSHCRVATEHRARVQRPSVRTGPARPRSRTSTATTSKVNKHVNKVRTRKMNPSEK